MGAFACLGVGGVRNDFEPAKKVPAKFADGEFANVFIFGEDPVGTAIDGGAEVRSWLEKADFVLVQEYFETETTKLADLILPASFPVETDGSFTNTQKVLQQFSAQMPAAVEQVGWKQLVELAKYFGLNGLNSAEEVFMEFVSRLPQTEIDRYEFHIGTEDSPAPKFNYGVDAIMMRFDKEFEASFQK
jgi:predicted molibdopterin-dependent oxidoreductase YjgC